MKEQSKRLNAYHFEVHANYLDENGHNADFLLVSNRRPTERQLRPILMAEWCHTLPVRVMFIRKETDQQGGAYRVSVGKGESLQPCIRPESLLTAHSSDLDYIVAIKNKGQFDSDEIRRRLTSLPVELQRKNINWQHYAVNARMNIPVFRSVGEAVTFFTGQKA